MNKRKNTRTLSRYIPLPMLLAAALLFPSLSHATPYATCLTNNGPGTSVSFRLNESGIVTLVWTNLSGSLITNAFGNRNAGLITTNMSGGGGPVPGDFTVIVAKTNTPGYISGVNLQISGDGTNGVSTNTLRFNAPRGVAVNTNPASAYFGRIYVANAVSGTTAGGTASIANTNRGDGIYLLNADFSDAVGQGTNARTATLGAFTNAADGDLNTPWRLSIGEDNNLYISDFSTNSCTIYVTDPDVLTGTNVLAGQGLSGTGAPLSPSPNHGRFGSSVIARGSTNAGNLVIYAIDSDNSTTSDLAPNHIMKYDIGFGPLPVDLPVGVAATNVDNTALLPVAGVTVDLASGPDGKFYAMQNRSDGTEGGLFVVDPNVDATPSPDGLWDTVYDSEIASFDGFAITNDILRLSRGVAISPDGKYMGIIRDDNQIWVVGLTNGIPDLGARRLVSTTPTTSIGRDITFDAAGNLYVVSSGNLLMRTYSPGYTTIAKTTLSGTFTITNITPNEVKIQPTLPFALEGTSDGSFTFTRSGDTSGPLTVTYVISGSATRGVDYSTNVFGIGGGTTNTVTFAAGIASTNVSLIVSNDVIGELTETVVFSLLTSSNYVSAHSLAATNFIFDDGTDLPNVNVRPLGLGFNELLPGRPAKFLVTISSVWNADVIANIGLTGDAVSGVDYVEPNTFTVTIPTGRLVATNTITPIDNGTIAPDKTLIYSILEGAGYTNLGAITTNMVLRNDDLAALPVLFSDDFETNSAPIWKTNAYLPDNDAVFSYDYNSDGIPPAPHTTNATTLGLKIRSHFTGVVSNGISMSPIGLVLTNDYRLRFDAWLNFNGPAPAGGTGSTEFMSVGMGVSEDRTNVVGSTSGTAHIQLVNLPGSSVIFAVDGDGGFAEATGDFMVYTNGRPVALNTNVFPGNSRDNLGAYYAEFGDVVIPSAQTALFPASQTGASAVGALAFAWHDVIATKVGNTYTLDIDGLRIANINYATPVVGSNFSVGYFDQNASIAAVPQMNAAIIDNLIVEKLPPSTNANLAGLTLTPPGTLFPAFNAATLTYAATNAAGTPATVTATVSHPEATLQLDVNGGGFAPLTSGVASGALPLNLGNNTVVVRVTAPDATTTKDYTANLVLIPNQTRPTLTNSVSGSVLTLSWTESHIGYRLENQTNALSSGLGTNWFTVPASASTNTVSITVDPANPTVFYRLVYP